MSEYFPSPEWLQQMHSAAAAPSPRDEFVRGLRARLAARGLAFQSRRRVRARLAWGFALVAILLAAAVLIAGPQNVVSALQKILGYIPGIGIVQPSSIRVLAEPVTVTRDGVTLTLEQVVADPAQTIVVYKAEGLSVAAANSNGEGGPLCSKPDVVRLPDGTELAGAGGGGGGWGSGYRSRLIYGAMPLDVNEGTLVVPCIMDMPPGKAPEDWSLPFRLKPAPPDLTVVPVVELPTPTVELSTPLSTPGAAKTEAYGIAVTLEKIIPLEDGYVLLGNLRSYDERFSLAGNPLGLTVIDSNGMQIPAQWDQADVPMTQPYDPSMLPFAYRIQGKSFHGPLTLGFSSMSVHLNSPVRFSFDTGPDPTEGKSWEIDRELGILGIPVRVVSATLMDFNGRPAFELALQLPAGLRSLQVGLEDSPGIWKTPTPASSGGEGGGGGGGRGEANAAGELLTYVFPDGQIVGGRINLTVFMAVINGNWNTTWNPPVVAGAPTATPQPRACLTGATWNALSAAPSVPAGLGGTILTLHGTVAPNPSLFLSGLDGSGEKGLLFGDGSLSPDGGKLVYAGAEDRIDLFDLASARSVALTSPGVIGYHPLWSPDGKYIAMNQFLENDHVFVMNADGLGLRRVTHGVSIEFLVGWSPDGKQVFYAQLGDGGKYYLHSADLETGAVADYFSIAWKNPSPAVSPDGTWVAFLEPSFGAPAAAVYIMRLDGSDRRMMTHLDAQSFYAYAPFWSPDGRWLAVSIQNANALQPGDPSIALIQPDTCEATVLPNVKGEIRSWVPSYT